VYYDPAICDSFSDSNDLYMRLALPEPVEPGVGSRLVRLAVLTGVAMKITVLWDVTPCSLIDLCEHSGGICSPHPNVDLVTVTKFLSGNKMDSLFKGRACYELHSLYPGGTRFKI
jgi:hypothetical protein